MHELRTRLALALIMLALLSSAGASELRHEILVSGLSHPWSLAFLPDGRMLVTERSGQLRMIAADGSLYDAAVAGVPTAYVNSQAGLFEVLPATDFTDSGLIYLSMVSGSHNANSLRVYRGQLQEHELVAVEEIFRAEPLRHTPVHYGGRLLWLPDGSLLVSHGDGFDFREDAQRLHNHTGSVLRLNADGSVPADNPFVDDSNARAEIFSYGHRNVQGLALDTQSGRIWQHEHGPRGGDELNLLIAGENYGWPIVAHAPNYSGERVTPFTALPGVRNPQHIWQRAIAPGGLAVYHSSGEHSSGFADWQGDLLVAGLASRALHRLRLDGTDVISEQRLLQDLDRRLREVRVGPDGAIYLLTDHADGELIRVTIAN